MVNKWKSMALNALLLLSVNHWCACAHAASVESETFRFDLYNDFYFNKDNKITSGWSLQKHTAVASSWSALENVPDFVREWGARIPGLTKEGMVYRAGTAVSQLIQTPADLSRRELIKDDVPYAAALTVQEVWYAFNDDEFRGFEVAFGLLGPFALGREIQDYSHKLTGNGLPQGWSNQLETEPLVNFNYKGKQKVLQWHGKDALAMDIAINGDVGLGNMYTQLSLGLEMRFGHNMPTGFAYIPVPVGTNMHYNASLKAADAQEDSYYVTLLLSERAFAHNIFLDGNTYRNSHSVDKETRVGLVVAGLHYEREHWGLHLHALMSSADVKNATMAQADERLGMVTLDYRF